MILGFGRSGQVAQALRSLDVPCFGRDRVDLRVPGQAGRAIRSHRPRAVINAAAFTDVDGAETDPDAAHRLNAAAVGEMARTCAALDIPFVHISTDYVFDGSGDHLWCAADAPAPLNVYGASKWAGEQAVRAAGGPHVILRTSWVFSPVGKNFSTTMQRLAQTRKNVSVVSDQIGGPTPAAAIAGACVSIADQLCQNPQTTGTYHFAGTPHVSWAGFARGIFDHIGADCQVQDIPSSAYPTPARRPLNSRLDCASTTATFGLSMPQWDHFHQTTYQC